MNADDRKWLEKERARFIAERDESRADFEKDRAELVSLMAAVESVPLEEFYDLHERIRIVSDRMHWLEMHAEDREESIQNIDREFANDRD